MGIVGNGSTGKLGALADILDIISGNDVSNVRNRRVVQARVVVWVINAAAPRRGLSADGGEEGEKDRDKHLANKFGDGRRDMGVAVVYVL